MRLTALALSGLVAWELAGDSAQAGDDKADFDRVSLVANLGLAGPAAVHEVRGRGHHGHYRHHGPPGFHSRHSFHHPRHPHAYRHHRPHHWGPPVPPPYYHRSYRSYRYPYSPYGFHYRGPGISFGIGF